MPIPKTPSEARAIGATHYRGAMCFEHPKALRYASSSVCVECAKLRRLLAYDSDKERERKRAFRAAAKERDAILFADLV